MKKSVMHIWWNIFMRGICAVLRAEDRTTTFTITDASLFCSFNATTARHISLDFTVHFGQNNAYGIFSSFATQK